MDANQKKFVIDVLRRSTFKWKPRNKAKSAAKEQIGTYSTGRAKYAYRCRGCCELFKSKDVQVDHIDPIVPLGGFKSGLDFDLNEYVERMLCYEDQYQVLCKPCHKKKTNKENVDRKKNRISNE